MSTATETDLERTVREEQEAHDQAQRDQVEQFVDGTGSGADPDAGKLFDVPRVKVLVDETDPTVLKLALAGGIELERAKADDVEFFNGLNPGKNVRLLVDAFVAGEKTTHRRDGEGDVDAVVTTKSLIVHSVTVE